MTNELKCMIKAAKKGGKIVSKHFGKNLEVTMKSKPRDAATKADTETEAMIIKTLSEAYPDFNILSEEIGAINKNSEYTFIIDPLDGSNNFIAEIPYFSISIGLLRKDEIIAGIVYNPILNQTFRAEKDNGAFLNDKKITVNSEKVLTSAKVAFSSGYNNFHFFKEDYLVMLRELHNNNIYRILTNWSVALDLCLLASGKLEVVILNDVEIHDFAAGKLIAKEAGALITDLRGGDEKNDRNRSFIASNGTNIHNHIIKII